MRVNTKYINSTRGRSSNFEVPLLERDGFTGSFIRTTSARPKIQQCFSHVDEMTSFICYDAKEVTQMLYILSVFHEKKDYIKRISACLFGQKFKRKEKRKKGMSFYYFKYKFSVALVSALALFIYAN